MQNDSNIGRTQPKAWTRPQLTKLGTIEDVMGNGKATTQGTNQS